MEPAYEEQARRTTFWLRLAIVPLIAVLAAILLLARDEAAGKPVKTKNGTTTQGQAFKLGVDGDGRAATLGTTIVARCPSGRTVSMPWDSVDGDGVRFRRDGDRLRIAERGKLWQLGLDGRYDEKGVLSGSLRLVVHVEPETKPAYDCTSKNVRFTAR